MQSSSNHDIVSNQLSFDDDCEMIPINHGGTSSSNKSLCHDHRPRYEIYTILILSISLLLALSKISQQRADIKYLIDETGKLNKFSVEVNENPSTFDEAQLKSDTTMKPKKYSIIPEKIYTVIGLESSGTQFMSSILTKALGLEHYREGSFPCNRNCDEYATVQVQHFSLPWGSTCDSHPNPKVVDVVLPSQCTRQKSDSFEISQCDEMAKDLWGFKTNRDELHYPDRYQLDIVSHKDWYDLHGVQQYIILVIRDSTISSTARSRDHCGDSKLLEREEEIGTQIIARAINKYILEAEDEKASEEKLPMWTTEKYKNQRNYYDPEGYYSYEADDDFTKDEIGYDEEMNDIDEFNDDDQWRRSLGALPTKNNVVVVSYEALLKLKGTYLKTVYSALDIQSDYIPSFKDGNSKYINGRRANSSNK